MLKGKTAIVTGSNSGIGLGIAQALAGQGCNVVLNSFTDSPEDHALAERIAAEHGIEARYLRANMSKAAECVRLVEDSAAAFGTVDILVNNAGIQHVARVEEFPVEKWDAILAINLSSAFHTIRALPVSWSVLPRSKSTNSKPAVGFAATLPSV